MNETSFIDSSEGPYNTGKKYENGNMGHRPGIKGGYFPVPPGRQCTRYETEYLKALKTWEKVETSPRSSPKST